MDQPSPPAPTAGIVAVVVTYDGSDLLDRCLGALAAIHAIDSIIVVDNASADDSPRRAAEFSRTSVLALPCNVGFGRANNAAFRQLLAAPPEFILLVNQDAWLDADCLATLLRVARDDPTRAIVSPLHLQADARSIDPLFAQHLASRAMAADLLSGHGIQPVYHVDFVNAALWLMRGDLLAHLGGFDPLFPHYGEDFEYCDRLRRHNLKVAVATTARAVHARIHTAGRRPFTRRGYVRGLASRQRADALAILRTQSDHFHTRILHWLAHSSARLDTAVRERKLTHVEAVLRAFLHCTALLPWVWWHRRLVRRLGPHFLAPHCTP